MLVLQLWSPIFSTKSLIIPWKVFVHYHKLIIKILSSAKKKWLKWVKAPLCVEDFPTIARAHQNVPLFGGSELN
jgi:hypothetical protein